MVDQMLFIFGEILCANVFDLFQLFFVSFIDVIVVTVNIFCSSLDKLFQLVDFTLLACSNIISQEINFGPNLNPDIIMFLTILIGIIRLVFFKIVNPDSIIILQLHQIVLGTLFVFKNLGIGLLLFFINLLELDVEPP